MLTLTENASTIVKTLTDQAPGADGGVRISTTNTEATAFAVAVAPAPEPTDQVVENEGARVFLEENAAVALDDKVLDARLDPEGEVSFALGALA